MARRPTRREQQKVIVTVIVMWFDMIQQYMVMLSKMAVAQALLLERTRADKGKTATASSGTKRKRQQVTEDYLASIQSQMFDIQASITKTGANIERLANTFCLPEHLVERRKNLVDELKALPRITYHERLKAARLLMKDHADLEIFFQMRNDEMKVDFILSILE